MLLVDKKKIRCDVYKLINYILFNYKNIVWRDFFYLGQMFDVLVDCYVFFVDFNFWLVLWREK